MVSGEVTFVPEIKEVIKDYHTKGYCYHLIHVLLEEKHHCIISFNYLQRKLIPSLGLKRRGQLNADLDTVLRLAKVEIDNGIGGSEQLRRTLAVKYNLRITREISRELVRLLDEDGIEIRRRHRLLRRQYMSKGPNYCWHIDGYDKLTPYGICIHGCIDGFSRKIIWLKAGITNKRPEVIGKYFIDAALEEDGLPKKVRGDYGTENVLLAEMIRDLHGQDSAFIYGRSTSNQRIERWWAFLRNTRSDFWINQFKILEETGGLLKDNPIHRFCIQYSFLPFINKQLEEIRLLWNSHSIRHQRKGNTVSGIPEILHNYSDIYGAQNYLQPLQIHSFATYQLRCQTSFLELDEDLTQVAEDVLGNFNLPHPDHISTFNVAADLYKVLSSSVESLIKS